MFAAQQRTRVNAGMQEIMNYNFSDDHTGVHRLILDQVPTGSRVLDVGCASGYLGEALGGRKCEMWGIEPDLKSFTIAQAKGYKKIINSSIEEALPLLGAEGFDVIIVADVLEHLVNPNLTLNELKRFCKPNGKILVSLPNVAHYSVRQSLLFGKWDMTDTGILDRTHLHFFTLKTIKTLFKEAGWEIEALRPRGDLERWFRKIGLEKLGKKLLFLFPELWAVQFVLTARPL